jgi:hypothetical protein
VIEGQKWGANLWVWNGVRAGIVPSTGEQASTGPAKQINAHFSSLDVPEAELFWQTSPWGKLPRHGIDPPLGSNTFPRHVWTVKIRGQIVMTWTIADEPELQEFVLKRSDIEHLLVDTDGDVDSDETAEVEEAFSGTLATEEALREKVRERLQSEQEL